MQMTISTTGRRRLCILCSVYVLSKMLKLCGAEGSSFSWLMGAVSCCCWDLSDFVSEVNLVAEQRLVCVGLHQIDPLWCCCQIFLLRSIKLCFWGGSHCCVQMLVSEVAYCLIQQLVVWSLDAVNSLLLYQRPGVVHQTHWLLGFVRVFGSECPALRSIRSWFLRWISFFTVCWVFRFNAECSEMRHVRWWACSGSNRLCRQGFLTWPFCGIWLIRMFQICYALCWGTSDLVSDNHLLMKSDVCFWGFIVGVEIHQTLFLRWISLLAFDPSDVSEVGHHWHWYHSVFVTIVWYLGSLMAQDSCFVTMS